MASPHGLGSRVWKTYPPRSSASTGNLDFPNSENSEGLLLPPVCSPSALNDAELVHMKAVFDLENTAEIPTKIFLETFRRLRLRNVKIMGSMLSCMADDDRRRYCHIHVCSTSRRRVRGAVDPMPANVYGAVVHYVLVHFCSKTLRFRMHQVRQVIS